MEGTHLQAYGPILPYQSAYALLHFTRSLVGKGQRKNVPGSHIIMVQQIGYLVGQHTRLS